MLIRKLLVVSVYMAFVFAACKKSETSGFLPASAYYPLQSGQVWVYRLDSTTLASFGAALLVHSYHLKDSVGVSFADNTGRTSWPVYRFITDTTEQDPWQSIATYYVTPTHTGVEVVDDNNLRFIKLASPVVQGNSWMGNSYIDTRSAASPYQYLDGWTYLYDSVNLPKTVLAGTIDSTVTILQHDETSPDVPFDPQFFQQRNYSVEVYAYNVGLIYKNFLHWTWQPTPAPASFQDDSYGIVLNLIREKQ